MTEVIAAFAKLAGVLKGSKALLTLQWNPGNKNNVHFYDDFRLEDAKPYFEQAVRQVAILRQQLPELYDDLPPIMADPDMKMAMPPGAPEVRHYSRSRVESLVRAIDQIFEIRANSEMAEPKTGKPFKRVFLTHGTAPDWREVQAFIERDLGLTTLELAQQPNLGRSVLEKLEQESSKCDSAVIVMTGDDVDSTGNTRARENVLHEIGYFQSKYGLSRVCLLHEEGTNIPSNIHGLVYIPFTKGHVSMTFGPLLRELRAFYGL